MKFQNFKMFLNFPSKAPKLLIKDENDVQPIKNLTCINKRI